MTRALVLILGVALIACADVADPDRPDAPPLSFTPDFGANAIFANDADRLRVLVQRREGPTVFVTQIDTSVTIDPTTGSVTLNLPVVLLSSPQQFRVVTEAIRVSDQAVLFRSDDTVSITTGLTGTGTLFTPRARYVGPQGASIQIGPRDTALASGAGMTFRATVRDAGGAAMSTVPVRFELVNPLDSTLLQVNRYTGAVTTTALAQGIVRVVARTPSPGSVSDTGRVLLGAVPVGVLVTPGYANVGAGGTSSHTGAVVDALNNPLPGGTVTWETRNPLVATVSTAGVVTGVGVGVTRVVASAAALLPSTTKDSIYVVVSPPGNALAVTTSNGRTFRTVRTGQTIDVEVMIDMRRTAGPELLGSYNAELTWNPAVMTYSTVEAGGFGLPEVNPANTASGSLRFAQANATGTAGAVVVARVRFNVIATGNAGVALTLTELSAAVSFTNLINNLTVQNGTVTVVP